MSKRYPGGIIRKTPQTPSQTSAQGIWDMASVTQAVKENTWPIAGVPDPISRSLRFRSSASAYLNRTPASAGNRKTWTFSAWIKRGTLGSVGTIIHCYDGSSSRRSVIQFNSDNTIGWDQGGSGTSGLIDTVAVYRDPSAWYHLVCVANYSNGTAANRALIYVNGVLQAVTTADDFDNDDGLINSTNAHQIGSQGGSGNFFDGYMTEVYLIDGQALTPSSFGSTNDQTGVWQPIAYTGTYGTNGFYLPFSNTASTSTLGNDFSGNSNNWTTNNISLTSGVTYDSMTDVPTQWIPYNTAGDTGALWRGNYCVFNPLGGPSDALQGTLSNGNLTWTSPATDQRCVLSTMPVNGDSTGQWYCEVTAVSKTSTYWAIGMFPVNINQYSATSAYAQYRSDGAIFVNGSNVATVASYTAGDVIGMTYNASTSQIAWYKNNSLQTTRTVANSAGLLSYFGCGSDNSGGTNVNSINFGQRPFAYAPPSGFLTLNTRNLPTPTIGATASTQAGDYFNAVTWTGTGNSGRSITGVGFQPDFVWAKNRTNAYGHVLFDVLRGAGGDKELGSQVAGAEGYASTATYDYLSAFNTDGFTSTWSGSNFAAYFNNSGNNFVAWNWKANGAGVTNTAGSITSTVSANTSAGFSIVTYTGTGSNATVGHGLGVAPSMVIVKSRVNAYNWVCYNSNIGNTNKLYLDLTDGSITDSTAWNNTSPTSSTFSLGSNVGVNQSSSTYVAYCFAPVAGYSAFGSYTGNGSNDGPFIYTGFRPRFIMIKASSAARGWIMFDTARDPYNVAQYRLFANTTDAESSGTTANNMDILSNGFKLRLGSNSEPSNENGTTYIYMAFAESPFKYALAR